jgi:hypothetical protein
MPNRLILSMINKVTKIVSLVAFCSLLYTLPLEANVTGNCSNCHTMHNSQNGQPMAYDFDGTSFTRTSTAKGSLLIYDCLGCHSTIAGNTWQDSLTKAPIVFNTNEPSYNTVKGLAAGNFFYVSTTVDNTGHNIFSTNPDETLDNTPPGGGFPSGGNYTGQLRCAGTRGCHGHNGGQNSDSPFDNETQAIKGAHHGDDTPPLEGSLTDVARNYRFLLGIKGKEDDDWEQDNTNTSHNEYKGSTSSATDTISYLCAECHGNFHTWVGGSSEVGTASPWLRHPTDIVLDATGEYSAYTVYNMAAPVARPEDDYPGDPTIVRPGTDIIMCLSCHRAHASPYFKMVRWDYNSTNLSDALSGCNVCHTSKD